MKNTGWILFFLMLFFEGKTQNTTPGFTWGNTAFFDLAVGESCVFNNTEIQLLELENHFNKIKVGNDTVWVKTSRRSLPIVAGNLWIYVADNKNVKALTSDAEVHGLLQKDALIALADYNNPLLDFGEYVFPVSFNDGFVWDQDVDKYPFSYLGNGENPGSNFYRSHEGIQFDLSDVRTTKKHWLVAIESSTVVWIAEKPESAEKQASCVLLKSITQPGIYYVYDNLLTKNLEIKEGQELVQGEILGTVWSDKKSGYLQFAVVKSDSVPTYKNRYANVLGFYPQLYQLYYRHPGFYTRNFSKGIISFGLLNSENGNTGNVHAFEEHSGRGWQLATWNTADKVEFVSDGHSGNARLSKKLFAGSSAECVNPNDYYDYEINVPNGLFRIRAKIGDLKLPSWQKISFEGVEVTTANLLHPEYKWTNERIVRVNDARLTIRIFFDPSGNKIAGISEIVFQKAN